LTHRYSVYILYTWGISMRQLNIHMSPGFARDLQKFMKIRRIKTKSEAIRTAIKEGIVHSADLMRPTDFNAWLGLGLQVPLNKYPKFKTDNDLWN
jgi:hypothetical protein